MKNHLRWWYPLRYAISSQRTVILHVRVSTWPPTSQPDPAHIGRTSTSHKSTQDKTGPKRVYCPTCTAERRNNHASLRFPATTLTNASHNPFFPQPTTPKRTQLPARPHIHPYLAFQTINPPFSTVATRPLATKPVRRAFCKTVESSGIIEGKRLT